MSIERRFLFLQGPHGPFFRQMAGALRKAGATVWRVGFNAGDAAFWWRSPGYLPFRDNLDAWPAALARILHDKEITDIVLYGDTRPVHAEAVRQARAAGLRIHVFEEGYLRPYWITYERDGSNGHSHLRRLSLADMRAHLAQDGRDMPTPPAHWGDMRQHIFYGALYHWFVMFRNARYPQFRPHRALSVQAEARLYSRRLLMMPFHALLRGLATLRIKAGGYPYHLALLQLEHDSSFQMHSPFRDMETFIDVVVAGFAKGASAGHHLVFKAHPLENGRKPLRRLIRQAAAAQGIADRVHYVRGGKLAQLLDKALSAVTINSTAGQQVLWRGIPLRIFGAAVYDKPDFVSDQPLPAFFAAPRAPDAQAYRDFRQFLLETSQVPGGFYSIKGRRHLTAKLVPMMLADRSPYDSRLDDEKPREMHRAALVKVQRVA
ncbi:MULTISPECIES: capsular biosynthesis protein [unclassified Yoonia]|uniref:capsule biosynthesis protein n=1 Tax=unclassified Yoonia TaxID=2629118 RepID=UPI002AFF628F|nr:MULTISPECIES: capsular biosynthesis protein [unclassified Yoonia]